MAHHRCSLFLYVRERGQRTRNSLQTLGSQLRNSPERSDGLETQNRKYHARPGPPGPGLLAPGLLAQGCSPRASRPGLSPTMAHHGSRFSLYWRETGQSIPHSLQSMGSQLRNSPERSDGLETQNGKCPTRPGPPGPGLLSPWPQTRGCSLWACSPQASRPRAASPGPPHPGLLAPDLLARGCLLPWLIVPEASPCT